MNDAKFQRHLKYRAKATACIDKLMISFAQGQPEVHQLFQVKDGEGLKYYFVHPDPFSFSLGEKLADLDLSVSRRTEIYMELHQIPQRELDRFVPSKTRPLYQNPSQAAA